MEIAPDVAAQLADLRLDPAQPLIVTDADEVLFHFMEGLEAFLGERGFRVNLDSYALRDSIRRADGTPLSQVELAPLLQEFFVARTTLLRPVDLAAAVLARLATRAQVVVLSNVPLPQAEARRQTLARHGMPYPLIANSGSKGGVVAGWAAASGAPIVFIDDIPRNLDDVARAAPDVLRIHYVADARLARIVPAPQGAHHRATDWTHIGTIVADHFGAHGH